MALNHLRVYQKYRDFDGWDGVELRRQLRLRRKKNRFSCLEESLEFNKSKNHQRSFSRLFSFQFFRDLFQRIQKIISTDMDWMEFRFGGLKSFEALSVVSIQKNTFVAKVDDDMVVLKSWLLAKLLLGSVCVT